jgi:hypothetical protein
LLGVVQGRRRSFLTSDLAKTFGDLSPHKMEGLAIFIDIYI